MKNQGHRNFYWLCRV